MFRGREIIRMDCRMGRIVLRTRFRRLGASLSAAILFWFVRSPGFSRLHHSMTAKFPWLLGSCYRWFSVVRRYTQLRVSPRSLHMLSLYGDRRDVPLIRRRFFLRCGACFYSSVATVVANPIHGDVIDRRVVNVVDIGDVHIAHGAVIEKMSIVPASARKTHAEIPESIVDSTIET